jgi:DNA-binding response OmpR family regulator
MNILVVEDNEAINNLLVTSLRKKNYTPFAVFDGKSAADFVETHSVDLVLLDIMLPEISGDELIAYFIDYDIPVIFLTAKDQLSDKVKGLNLGADDYITKPFELEELFARIETVLRRIGKRTEASITWQNIRIETNAHSVFLDEQLVSLTPKEYKLLLYFINNKGIVLQRSTIYQAVWETNNEADTRTVDLHVRRIRSKLHLEKKLRTVYGTGYLLEE